MARGDLPAGVLTAAQLDGYMALLAVEIQTAAATYLRLVQGDVARTIDGDTYSPAPFTFSPVGQEGPPKCVVRLYNTDGAISTADETAPFVENERAIRVYEVHWSAAGVQLDPVTLFDGYILGARYNAKSAELQGGTRAAGAVGQVGRICGRLCNYGFKDANCAYAGADTSCLKTLAACTAKSNQARYGGFPTMPERGKKIQYTLVKTAAYSDRVGRTGYPPMAAPPAGEVHTQPGTPDLPPTGPLA